MRLKNTELYPPVVFGKETSYSCGPGYRRHPVTCRLLVSQKAFPQRDVLSCAEDRTGQEAPPVDSCVHFILLESPCEKETDLEFPAQQIFVGYLLLTACDGYCMVAAKAFTLLEVYLRRTTGGFPSPVGTAIGDVLLLWTRQ